jgi:hypothetical protein
MKIPYPPVGSKWKDRDPRVIRTIQVIRYDLSKQRVRIVCLETDRLTWAKVERFNGKSGGYAPVSSVQIGPNAQRAKGDAGKPVR